MLEAGATALEPRRGRLEWLGPIPAEASDSVELGPVGRTLDFLDIVAASALTALFAAIKR
ncbi:MULTISPECIES: hypothetical protein [Sphingomonas]|uniref:hypothetical protein n=1 Tax=Sphingomonas TaxID=13687 RepID=UPI000DEFE234|nr:MULTISPECIES: hypothetical protein [Sphingomonas]